MSEQSPPSDPPSGVETAPTASGDGAPPEGTDQDQIGDGAEMPFLDHLEEFRWRLFKGLAGVLVGAIVCSFFADIVVDVLLIGPTRPTFFMYDVLDVEANKLTLLNRTLTGQFFAYWGTVLVVGVVVGFPVFLYQFWAFIEPGLYPGEKKGLRFSAIFATFFFMLGVAFGYLILTPLAVQFFAQFTISEQIVNEFDITKYFSMVLMWSVGAGLLFELPVVVYFLSKLGVLSPQFLRDTRPYALVVVLLIAAFLTPPDPISQIIMAVPLVLLYEGSIYVSAWVERRRRKALGMETEE